MLRAFIVCSVKIKGQNPNLNTDEQHAWCVQIKAYDNLQQAEFLWSAGPGGLPRSDVLAVDTLCCSNKPLEIHNETPHT